MKIWELLSDESKWTKDCQARNAVGLGCSAYDPQAVCWCLGGAFLKCYEHVPEEVHAAVLAKIVVALPVSVSVPKASSHVGYWNDKEDTTFSQVHELVKRLDV